MGTEMRETTLQVHADLAEAMSTAVDHVLSRLHCSQVRGRDKMAIAVSLISAG